MNAGLRRYGMEDTEKKEWEELSEEALAELMGEYKRELAQIYKAASAKRALLTRRAAPGLDGLLRRCDEDMRADITALKRKYGIHY